MELEERVMILEEENRKLRMENQKLREIIVQMKGMLNRLIGHYIIEK